MINFFTKRFNRMKNKKGFTLVELIVVIVIIGILAAILIPRLTGFTDKAKGTQAIVYAKEVATAIDSFYAEKSVWPSDSDKDELEDLSGVDAESIDIGSTSGAFYVTYTDAGSNDYYAGRVSESAEVKMMESKPW